MLDDKFLRNTSKPDARKSSGDESDGVVRFKAPFRPKCDQLVAVKCQPSLCPLHDNVVSFEFFWRFWSTTTLDVFRRCHIYGWRVSDFPGEQVRVGEVTDPDGAIKSFRDQVNEAVRVASANLQLGIKARQFRDHGREVCRAERQRSGDP